MGSGSIEYTPVFWSHLTLHTSLHPYWSSYTIYHWLFPVNILIPYSLWYLRVTNGELKSMQKGSIVCSFPFWNEFGAIILQMSLQDHQTCPSPSLALNPLISDPRLLHAQILFFFRKKEGNVWSPCLLLGYTSDGFNHPWVIFSHHIHRSFFTPVHPIFHHILSPFFFLEIEGKSV